MFDALIDQRARNAWSLSYEHRLTQIRLTDHADTFGSSTRLPPSSLPPGMSDTLRQRLAALTPESLHAQLGELLGKRDLKALLRRRDALLQWPGLTVQ